MKMVIAIVQDDDALNLVDELTELNFGVTKLATTGGFLKSGNTTLLMGVEKERVEEIIDIIKKTCKNRSEMVAAPTPIAGDPGAYIPYPVEVKVGGATVFVLDVDQFVRL